MLSQHMLICLGMCFHCTCFWSLKSTVVVKCSHRDLQRSKSCFSYTVHSLNADTMSNISVSHKIPTLYLLGENICWMLFEYLFLLQVKTSDSCHVQLKHNPPKSPNYNSELRPTLSTILQGLFAPTCRTSTHESFLNILNFISLKLNLLSFHSDLFIFFYNGKTPF